MIASIGEYNILTSPPSAFTDNKSFFEPGTRSISPNEQNIISFLEANSIALSICSNGVTQTGQPGPWINVISFGSNSSIPNLTIECVCPPQTSIIFHGFVVIFFIIEAYFKTASASLYSSRYFTIHLPLIRQDLPFLLGNQKLCLLLIHLIFLKQNLRER